VAYDEELADRIRGLLVDEPLLTEQRMFGGLAFMIGGHMAVAASSRGLLVRVDPAESETLLATTSARPMEMRGREMKGWLRVGREQLDTPPELERWVQLGRDYARSLPAKD